VDEGELYVYTGPNPFELLAQTAVLTPASRPASDELCRRVDLIPHRDRHLMSYVVELISIAHAIDIMPLYEKIQQNAPARLSTPED